MFDKIKTITLKNNDREIIITMSPIKIKHLDDLERLKNYHDDEERVQQICLKLIEETIDVDLSMIPTSAFQELIDILTDFNFKNIKDGKAKKRNKNHNETILQCIDFLISEGHRYDDILNYSIFEFTKFVDLASDRNGGYKKKTKDDPVAMLQKIGVKIDG
jgi:hypothetical protein